MRESSSSSPFSLDVLVLFLCVTAFVLLTATGDLAFSEDIVNVILALTPERFVIIFLMAGIYWFVDWVAPGVGIGRQAKPVILVTIILLVTMVPLTLAIGARAGSEPHHLAHDGLIQSEEATRFVLNGQNPYEQDYSQTPMADWPFQVGDITQNPALFHYPYLPMTFLLPLPFQWLGETLWGWFDHRLVYVALFVGLMTLSASLTNKHQDRLALLILLGVNPAFVLYFVEGRNDILPLFWLAATLYLLQRKHESCSAVTLALGCMTKQFLWFFVPFYVLYVGGPGDWPARWQRIRRPLATLIVLGSIIALPWLLWSPQDFVEDTLLFQSGAAENGYPINGYGFSTLLLSTGVLDSHAAHFPFWIMQALVGIPLLVIMLRRQWAKPDLRTMVQNYALWLACFSFFSRAFNDNYLGYLITVLAIGLLTMSSPLGFIEESDE